MADEFPEDSFFRNSNVAVLEAALQEKDINVSQSIDLRSKTKDEHTVHPDPCLPAPQFVTAKELLISTNSAKPSTSRIAVHIDEVPGKSKQAISSSQSISILKAARKKALKTRAKKAIQKSKKSVFYTDHEIDPSGPSNYEKTDILPKEKSKNSYRPLNISKNVFQCSKQTTSSFTNITQGNAVSFSQNSNIDEETNNNSSLLSTQQKLSLDAWGLPQSILRQYAKRGITEMFPWQVECLCCPGVLKGGNLVYSAPTSAGKTLVAEIVCIKTVLERRKKVLFVLPFVSVVREKMFYFQDIFRGSKVRVDGYMGGHSAPGGFRSLDIAVCTIEKANSLINRLMEENELVKLGAVVVDELHLIGDPHRGYLLELLLTKLKYMSIRSDEISVQIVGMSATLPNLSLLSSWLNADLFRTSFRPVPLEEYIKIGNTLLDSSLQPVRTINHDLEIKNDTEDIVYLCLETIANGHSVLIFCPTKAWCESLAQTVASQFRTIGLKRDVNAPESLAYKLREQLNPDRIAECLELLRSCPVGLDSSVGKVVSFGVAYHHAGLSMDERDILEGCFKNGTLRVLIATTTLSSGVNLPARRVIIRSPVFQGRPIDILSYRQMVGRAGRMGVDTAGESIIICQKTEQRIVASLVCSSLKPIESCLGLGDLAASLKRAILEVIASKVARTPEDLELYTNCTLLASSQNNKGNNSNPVSSCINFLEENELIRLQTDEDGVLHYTPTPLGVACLSASIHPDEGLRLFQELQRARQCFVLENELHLVYQVTPFNVADQWGNLDWLHVLSLWEQLPTDMRRVGELVGVEDRFIVRAMRGTINLKLEKQREKLLIHRRFYTALALHDLVNEVPLNVVAAKFNCSRGLLQSLQQSAATYAGMVTSFCRRLGWSSVELIIDQFQDRLHFGTHRELLDLLKLPSLNGPRARALHNAGITCVSELITADILLVENALLSTIPFLSDKERDGETTSDYERRKKLKGIWITGKHGLSEREAAELLIKEARAIIQAELGLPDVNWNSGKQQCDPALSTNVFSLKKNQGTTIPNVCSSEQLQFDENLNVENAATGSTLIEKVKSEVLSSSHQDLSKKEPSDFRVAISAETDHETKFNSKAVENKEEEGIESSSSQDRNPKGFSETTVLDVLIKSHEISKVERSIENLDSPLNSSKNVSSCILDHNICDVSSLSESLDNNMTLGSANAVTPKTSDRTSNNETKTLQNSMEDLFQSPFPSSALAKLDEHSEKALKQMDESTDSNLVSLQCKNSYSCLESCGITNSVLARLCVQEDSDPKDHSSKLMLESTEKVSSLRRMSWDLFAESPRDNESVVNIQNNCDKESEDLFGSCLIPDCNLLNQRDGESQSKFQQYDLQAAVTNVGESEESPSMFSESIQINSGLLEALERGKSLQTDPSKVTNTEDISVLNRNELQSVMGTCVEEFSSPVPELKNGSKEFRSRFFGCGKKLPKAPESLQSAGEQEERSLPELKRTTPTKKGGNLHLGLSRRGFTKRTKEPDEIKNSTPVEASKTEVLTDSFLEAAFETAFYNDSFTTDESPKSPNPDLLLTNVKHKLVMPNLPVVDKSPDRKRRKLNASSDEDILVSPQEYVHNKKLRKHHIGNSSKTEENEKCTQWLSGKQEPPLEGNNLIGPPLTRKMLSIRQKSNLDVQGELPRDDHTNAMCQAAVGDCLLNNPFQPSLMEDWRTFNVIDICRNKTLFETFAKEVSSSFSWSFSFACELNQITDPPGAIGSKIIKTGNFSKHTSRSKNISQLVFGDSILIGVSFCFGGSDAYFLTLETENEQCVVDLSDRIQLLKRIFSLSGSGPSPSVCCFDFKEHFKILMRCTGIQMSHLSVFDPKIGDWLLEPEGKEKTFPAMVLRYAEQTADLAEHAGQVQLGLGSPALDVKQALPGRQRSSVEAIVCYEIMSAQYQQLKEAHLLSSFIEVEMPVVECVARLELTGIGFCATSLEALQEKIQQEMSSLEEKAYLLAGRSFCLTSPADTARVLYQELRLGQGQAFKARQRNTSKETLCKLRPEHPLPDIILLWRKLNAIHSKTVCPLLPSEPCSRLFGRYILHTATGRISMHEPNIQCIPRDFDLSVKIQEPLCMRASFVASEGSLLVAADYSQLELRLLAHLSADSKLKAVLNGGEDVFRNLSAVWNCIPSHKVTDDLRQKSKQLCYGIIYGMGARALADQLEVDEAEASTLMETFHNTFPGIGEFLTKTVNQCREQGYVKTLLGRRRYLPGITSSNFHVKAHSERQAVNTTVQGSAADLTKTAMIAVERQIRQSFPKGSIPSGNLLTPDAPRLVLHLHDELMYEVPICYVDQFCQILKREMEHAMKLTIKLPVKMKVGATWGALKPKDIC